MREILFRAKCVDNGEWIEGYFVQQKNNIGGIHSCIFQNFPKENRWEMKRVDLTTVCQYTGLKDKNGKRIYEGDIFNIIYSEPDGECRYVKNYVMDDLREVSMLDYANEIEVVGNKYDN